MYTGDVDVSPAALLSQAKKRFGVDISSTGPAGHGVRRLPRCPVRIPAVQIVGGGIFLALASAPGSHQIAKAKVYPHRTERGAQT